MPSDAGADDSDDVGSNSSPSDHHEGLNIPEMPPSDWYDSLDDLMSSIQTWGRANGVVFVKKAPSNYRDVDKSGKKVPTRYDIICARNRKRPSQSQGLRQPSSQKTDCTFMVTATAPKAANNKWSYKTSGTHDHPPTFSPTAKQLYRRQTNRQQRFKKNIWSFEKDTAVQKLDATIYEADLSQSYCVGVVPNGGYVASIFLKVAREHLAPRGQPHTFSAYWTYLNKTQAGRALFRVIESKIGRATSILHISLHQNGMLEKQPWISFDSPPLVAAYFTCGNLNLQDGVTLPTQWKLDHAPPPVDLEKLSAGTDLNWCSTRIPIMSKVPMLLHLDYYARREGHALPTTHDWWVRLANGERFTQESLGFLADAGPPLLIESFRPMGPNSPIPEGGFDWKKAMWYPTLSMTLDVRRTLPEDGLQWVRLRVVAKEIRNGRFDAEVLMFDDKENIIALSNHVAMALDIERNYGSKQKVLGKI